MQILFFSPLGPFSSAVFSLGLFGLEAERELGVLVALDAQLLQVLTCFPSATVGYIAQAWHCLRWTQLARRHISWVG